MVDKKHLISCWAELLSKSFCWQGCCWKKGVECRSHAKYKGKMIRLQEFPRWIFLFHFSASVLYTR